MILRKVVFGGDAKKNLDYQEVVHVFVRRQPYRQLIDSIDNVAQTVEDSSAFVQGKKLIERHPFLTGLLGPSIVRKLLGR